MGAKLDVDDYSQYHGPALAALSGGLSAVSSMMVEKADRRKPKSRTYQAGRALIGASLAAVVYLICKQQNIPDGYMASAVYFVGIFNVKLIDLIWIRIKTRSQIMLDKIEGYNDKN